MNYGYDCDGWSKESKKRLATRLRYVCEHVGKDERGKRPYVEVDGMYPGVRVRRITHFSEDDINEMVLMFDAQYRIVEEQLTERQIKKL